MKNIHLLITVEACLEYYRLFSEDGWLGIFIIIIITIIIDL